MKLLGWTITRNKALQPVDNRGGWLRLIGESFAGAWQRDITIRVENVLTYTRCFRLHQPDRQRHREVAPPPGPAGR
jgi:hypothetical protein